MIKNLVGRIAGKNGASQDHTAADRAPASSGHGTPPRHEPSHKTSPAAQATGNAESAGKGNKRRRRGGKAKAEAAPWSVDMFPVDPKEGETRFHDLGLRDELMQRQPRSP